MQLRVILEVLKITAIERLSIEDPNKQVVGERNNNTDRIAGVLSTSVTRSVYVCDIEFLWESHDV